jgi:hypothetical protein
MSTTKRPTLKLESGAERHDRAWAYVGEGYRLALTELCAGDAQLGRLKRCLRQAQRLAGRRHLACVTATEGSK